MLLHVPEVVSPSVGHFPSFFFFNHFHLKDVKLFFSGFHSETSLLKGLCEKSRLMLLGAQFSIAFLYLFLIQTENVLLLLEVALQQFLLWYIKLSWFWDLYFCMSEVLEILNSLYTCT